MKLNRFLMWSALFWLALDAVLTVFYGRVILDPTLEGNDLIRLVIIKYGAAGLFIWWFQEVAGIIIASRIKYFGVAWNLLGTYSHVLGAISWVLVMLNGGMGR